jgi:hypothetical protein
MNFTDVLSGPIQTVPFLHDPPRSVLSRCMRRGLRQGDIERRPYGRSGNMRRIFMTGVRRVG